MLFLVVSILNKVGLTMKFITHFLIALSFALVNNLSFRVRRCGGWSKSI